MGWIDVIAVLILFFSFMSGAKEGAVRHFFNLLATLIAIPIAGMYYYIFAFMLAFLPGTDWENLFGFFITLGLVTAVLHLLFFLPGKVGQAVWDKGFLSGLAGGFLNLLNTGIGLVLFTLVLTAYPIVGWLDQVIRASAVLNWLVAHLYFVPAMLPDIFQRAASVI